MRNAVPQPNDLMPGAICNAVEPFCILLPHLMQVLPDDREPQNDAILYEG